MLYQITNATEEQLRATEAATAKRFPEFCKIAPDGVLEFYCDNHILSSLRNCEKFFEESIVRRLHPRGERPLYFDFGIWLHKCMEPYYRSLASGELIPEYELVLYGRKYWQELEMERFAGTKDYEAIGGLMGALLLLAQYYSFFGNGNERLRVIAVEVVFGDHTKGVGSGKEVPVVTEETPGRIYPYRAYLVGRPDVVVDLGNSIGPLDFKTRAFFKGSEYEAYKPYDALAGYVYGLKKMLGTDLQAQGKVCNSSIVTFLSKKETKEPRDRFKRVVYHYSWQELDEYERRQIENFNRLYELLVLGREYRWNDYACANWYHKTCQYHKLHRISPTSRPAVEDLEFEVKEPWNPITRGEKERSEDV